MNTPMSQLSHWTTSIFMGFFKGQPFKYLKWLNTFTIFSFGLALQAATVNVKDAPYNAAGDGTTNDRTAFSSALNALSSGDVLYIPSGTYRIVLTTGVLKLPAGTTMRGEADGSTILRLDSSGGTSYREFMRPGGSNITWENLHILRDANFGTVLFPIADGSNPDSVTIRNCIIEGQKDLYSQYCHGIRIGDNQLSNLLIEDSTITTCSYGLYGASSSTGSVNGVTVRNSTFHHNYATDLEFNAPNGNLSNVTVQDCVFYECQASGPASGWAVGLANVQTATILDNQITQYKTAGIHVEDESSNVLIYGNELIDTASVNDNPIIILSASNGVTVEHNLIDSRDCPRNPYLILVTAGGGSFTVPLNVDVDNNHLYNGPSTRAWYLQPGCGATPEGNVLLWECEDFPTHDATDAVSTFSDSNASDGAMQKLEANAAQDYIGYNLITVPEGDFTVSAATRTNSARGKFQLYIEGVAQGAEQDQYASSTEYVEFNLGTVNFPSRASRSFEFEVTGKNSASTGFSLALDYIKLVQPPTSKEIPASADAYVRGGTYANKNYGWTSGLMVKEDGSSSYDRWTYMQFDLSEASLSANTALLNLTPATIGGGAYTTVYNVYLVADDSWSESSITWNNKPTVGSLVATLDIAMLEAGVPLAVDISTAALNERDGDQVLSLVIMSQTQGNNRWVNFASSETHDGPYIAFSSGQSSASAIVFTASSFSDYSSQTGSPSSMTLEQNDTAIHMTGNIWRKYPFSYTITPDTMLEVTVNASDTGEIMGIGFDTDNSFSSGVSNFKLGGSQVHSSFIPITPAYTAGSGDVTYIIPVGNYLSGTKSYITFLGDDDAGANIDVTFSDIRIYEEN